MPKLTEKLLSAFRRSHAPYLNYVLPVTLIALATIIKYYAFSSFGHKVPFLLYLLAIIICAIYAGFYSSLVALLAASVFSASIYFLPELYNTIPRDPFSTEVMFTLSIIMLGLIVISNVRIQLITREKQAYFRFLADNAPLVIWQADTNCGITYFSKQWEIFSGMTLEESQGSGWRKALHPDDQAGEAFALRECPGEQLPFQNKFRLRRKDGIYRWFLAIGQPLINKSFEGYLGTLTDVTDQELMQQQSLTLLKKMDEFISIASHELKTPITSISGYLQIMERDASAYKSPVYAHFISRAMVQVTKLSSLVQDLLDISKINEDSIAYRMSEFNVKDLIEDAVEATRNSYPRHTVQVKGDTDFLISADKFRMEQVLCNLLSNAIKYSPEADQVILEADRVDNMLKVSVIDFGIGIPEEKQARIFDRFYRVENDSSKFTGLGIGLYICAEIIKKHHGLLQVHSEVGKGSVFSFLIPINGKAYHAAPRANTSFS